MKKCLSVILTVVMLIAMIPTTVFPTLSFAANVASGDWHSEEYEGDPYSPTEIRTTGSGTWTLDDEGTLTVRGSGELAYHYYEYWDGYFTAGSFPWTSYPYRDQIKSIVIESGITNIGNGIFGGERDFSGDESPYIYYHNLYSVTIPVSVTSIDPHAFSYYYVAEGIYSNDTLVYCYKDSYAHTYARENGILYALLDGTDEENTELGFAGRLEWALNKLTGVLTITGSGIMPPFKTSKPTWERYYRFIKSVVIGEGITSVSENAFSQSLHNPNSESADYYYEYGDYNNKSRIESVQLPSTIQSIGKGAFYGVNTLRSINIPNGVGAIENYAFAYCSSLPEVTLPDSVASFGGAVFKGCSHLQSAVLPAGLTSIPSSTFSGCSQLTDVTIPVGVTSINDFAFSGCGITSIVLPDGLQTINSYAFQGSNLETLIIPENVESIGYEAFYHCPALTSVEFNNAVDCSISSEAFGSCSVLNRVVFNGAGQCAIDNYAFQNCSGLQEVIFSPTGETTVGYRSFRNCTALANVEFNLVRSIGTEAFANCTSLTSVKLPGDMQSVSNRAFTFCTALDELYVYNKEMSLKYSTAYVEYDGQNIPDMTTPVNTKIIGYTGSTAQEYADAFNLRWNAIECDGTHSEHSFVPANVLYCGTSGYVTYVCEYCGKSYKTIETAAHSSHKLVFIPDAPDATCGYNGSGTYACEYCDYTYTDEGSLEHIYDKTYPNGVSCESFRDVIYTCTRCGDTYEVYEFVDHDWEIEKGYVNPSYTDGDSDMYAVYTCRRCGETHRYTFSYYHEQGWDEGHSYVRKVVKTAEKCGERDFVKYTCSVCGHFYTQWETSNSVHSSHKYALQEPPVGTLCGERYTATFVCEYCGDTYTEERTLGHKYEESGAVCETFCDVTYTCKYCDDSYTEENKFVDHDWDVVTINNYEYSYTDAETDYTKTYTCRRCGETHTYNYNEWSCDGEHSYQRKVIKGKCGEECFVKYTCSVCGNSYTTWQEPLYAEHEYEQTVIQEGDEENPKIVQYTCVHCGDSYTREIPHAQEYEIHAGETVNIYVPMGETVYLRFVPETSASYIFRSHADRDTYGYLYNADREQLASDDDGAEENSNFRIQYYLNEGETYYFGARYYSASNEGFFDVSLQEYIPPHEHEYSYRTQREYTGTCTYEEYQICYCALCGEELWQEYNGSGSEHSYTGETIRGNSCYEDGLIRYTCEKCGESYDEYIPAAHSFEDTWYSPSCTMMGFTRRVCTVCGYEEIVDVTNATGHRDVDFDGFCDICGANLNGGDVPAHTEHTYGLWRTLISASCAGKGAEIRSCSCGAFETRETEALGHADDDGDGVCDVCLCVISLPAPEEHTEHSFGEWKTVSAAACAAPGYEIRICACGEFETRQTEAPGHFDADQDGVCDNCLAVIALPVIPEPEAHTTHTFGDWTVLTVPTCTAAGVEIRTCTGCGVFETKQNEAAGHKDDDENGVCDLCEAVLRLPEPEAHTEHTFGEWQTVSVATCAAAGVEIRVCTGCGSFETRSTAVQGHVDADRNGVCDVCKAVTALPDQPGSGDVTPHTTHTYGDWTRISNPSCVTAGTEIRVCNGCSAFEVREVSAVGHLDDNGDGLCDRCKTALTVSGGNNSGSQQDGNGGQRRSFFDRIVEFFRKIGDFFRNLFRIR